VHVLLFPSVYLFNSLPALCPPLLICLSIHLPIYIRASLFICSSPHLLIKLICLSTYLFICPSAHLLVILSALLIVVSSSLLRILQSFQLHICPIHYLRTYHHLLNALSRLLVCSSARHFTSVILSYDIMYLAANHLI
jgi:hypothetical protein